MKLNNHIKLSGMLIVIVFMVSVAALAVLLIPAYSAENTDSVMLVPLTFENERWALGTEVVTVLPCAAPSKFINGTELDPLIMVIDSNKETLYKRNMRNPRLILIEEPSKDPALLEKVSFRLRFALMEGMETLEFWYDPQEQKEPSVVVDLREAIKRYYDAGGPNQTAPCQQPEVSEDPPQK